MNRKEMLMLSAGLRYGSRLDQFDYERMGAKAQWNPSDVVLLLTSFEMEVRGYFLREDATIVYGKIYSKYWDFVVNSMFASEFRYLPGYPEEEVRPYENAIDMGRASFSKDEFLSFLQGQSRIKIDSDKLRGFLEGRDQTGVFSTGKDEISKQACIDNIAAHGDIREQRVSYLFPDEHKTKVEQYLFEKTAQSWNLQFGQVKLNGVKNLVGMDYLKLLLGNPDISISVFELQIMLNPEYIKAPGYQDMGAVEDEEDSHTYLRQAESKRESKAKFLNNLRKRLSDLSIERSQLDPDYDYMELELLDNEVARIELEIDTIKYSKDEDPEVKRNRDKVAKAVKAALKNIKDLEVKQGFPSTPMFNYLDEHIKTGTICEYIPPKMNPPQWSF